MVAGLEDLLEAAEGAITNSPGEAVCLTNNICTKAVAEVTITVDAVATIAKVEDRQLTHNTITTMNQQIRETMIKLETAIILTMKVVHLHRNGD